jgi:hypothetical protein
LVIELEAKQSGAGAWGREALEEDSKRVTALNILLLFISQIFLPDTLLNTVKTLQAFTLIDVLYITFLCGYRPTTARHNVLTPISTDVQTFIFYSFLCCLGSCFVSFLFFPHFFAFALYCCCNQ